jgi:hypothetical protein
MIYLLFFVACVVCVGVASFAADVRKRALAFGGVCVGIAYLAETHGIRNSAWCYSNVSSVLMVTGIPIEILFGYFTAAFFMVIIVAYLPRISTEWRRREVMQWSLLLVGVAVLAYAYAYRSVPILVGWSLLGVYGMSVSRDHSIPLAVGMCALLADWLVESALTANVEYYSNGWNASIGLVFMFAGMFLAGILTHERFTRGQKDDGYRRSSPRQTRVEPVHSYQGGSFSSVFSEVIVRKP